jgi:hypothetical protein
MGRLLTHALRGGTDRADRNENVEQARLLPPPHELVAQDIAVAFAEPRHAAGPCRVLGAHGAKAEGRNVIVVRPHYVPARPRFAHVGQLGVAVASERVGEPRIKLLAQPVGRGAPHLHVFAGPGRCSMMGCVDGCRHGVPGQTESYMK